MEYKSAKCPVCGGNLPDPKGKKSVACEYCGHIVVRERTTDNVNDVIDEFSEKLQANDDPYEAHVHRTKDLTSNLTDAFEYTKHGLWGYWVKWIILIVCCFFPPLIFGYILQVMKGVTPAPELSNYVKMLIDGLMACVILFAYLIVPTIIWYIVSLVIASGSGNSYDFGAMIVSWLLSAIVLFILELLGGLFAIVGLVRFARSGSIISAFAFHEIIATIGRMGWITYVITLVIINGFGIILLSILGVIPIIGWIVALFGVPFIYIFEARAVNNLYDSTL